MLPAGHTHPRGVGATSQPPRGTLRSRRPALLDEHPRPLIELCAGAGFNPDIALEVDDPDLLPVAVTAGLGVGLVASIAVAGRAMPGLVWRPVADPGAAIPVVAVSARDGATAQTREFLALVETLGQRNRLLPPPSVDLTDGHPAGTGTHAPLRMLSRMSGGPARPPA